MSIIMTKNIKADNHIIRPTRTINLQVTDPPERKIITIKSNRERDKLIKTCEAAIRQSMEYQEYVATIKDVMDMRRCAVLPKIASGNGKKYSIELHHEPFRLYDIVDLEIIRREEEHEPLDVLSIAEYVTSLHYDGIVGLIPLSKTQHELIDSYKVFIPLQHIYQDYYKLYEMYEPFMEDKAEHIRRKIELKVQLSLQCGDIQSDCAEAEFVYLDVDGFNFPTVDPSWLECISVDRSMLAKEEEQKEKAEKKAAKKKL